MIYPTTRALVLIVAGAPVAVLAGAFAPQYWGLGLAWGLLLLLLVPIDALLAPRLQDVELTVPPMVEIGRPAPFALAARFARGVSGNPQAAVQIDPRLADGGRLDFALDRPDGPGSDGRWHGAADMLPVRRGLGQIERLWLRWTGPMGLGWRQVTRDSGNVVRILPDIGAIRSPTFQIFLKDAIYGLISRRQRGDGGEFEALTEYQPGMDRRSIDWKGSARHRKLLAKDFDTERNNQIVFALDCSSAMCEPVDGLPRIDRAVSAALQTGYVALKAGDRVSLFAFAARGELATPFVADSRNFHRLQRDAAEIDYVHQEPNFTLALSLLTARLQRRSLIVIFTEFTDPTSAELMLEAVGRLVERHLVLFVTIDDAELLAIADKPPVLPGDVAEAVNAQALLNQRALVITRLRHLGVDVIEARHDQIGPRLIDAYLKIKRRGQIG